MVQEATVSKVLLEGSTAVGVEYLVGGDSAAPQQVVATKEVILSAGVYATPKILIVRPHATWQNITAFFLVELATHDVVGVQLSGIGPAETLEEFGIPMRADLPVGEDAHVRLWLASQII